MSFQARNQNDSFQIDYDAFQVTDVVLECNNCLDVQFIYEVSDKFVIHYDWDNEKFIIPDSAYNYFQSQACALIDIEKLVKVLGLKTDLSDLLSEYKVEMSEESKVNLERLEKGDL